jgi:hypothetical protein
MPIKTTIELRDIEIVHSIFPMSLCTEEEFWHLPTKSFSFYAYTRKIIWKYQKNSVQFCHILGIYYIFCFQQI